jgi:hypothetical protein
MVRDFDALKQALDDGVTPLGRLDIVAAGSHQARAVTDSKSFSPGMRSSPSSLM